MKRLFDIVASGWHGESIPQSFKQERGMTFTPSVRV